MELKNQYHSSFYLTSWNNELVNECVLTLNASNFNTFVPIFNIYWNLFPNNNEIRLLIPQYNISFIMGKLGETSRLLTKRFQLDQIKVFTNLCPKSDERILLIIGQQRNLIKDCIEEIYFNLEEKNRNNLENSNIRFYNPANLLTDDIDKIMKTNIDYGGFIGQRNISNPSRLHSIEDEEYVEIILYLIIY